MQNDIETFTQEFRLTGSGDKFDWQVGAYYFKEDIRTVNSLPFGEDFRAFANVNVAALGGAQALALFNGFDNALLNGSFVPFGIAQTSAPFFDADSGIQEIGTLDNEAISLFGQFDYHINDRLTASVGLNFTSDEKEATVTQSPSDIFSGLPLSDIFSNPFVQGAFGLDATTAAASVAGLSPLQFLPPLVDLNSGDPESETSDDELTYTLRLAYDLSDNLNLYASYATGFKASSFNLSRDSFVGNRFAEPEEATVFEVGLKGRFERGAFNIALFDQSLENFQSNTFIGTGFALSNAEEQSVYGAEFDITYYPVDALQITFAATLLEPEFDSFTQGTAVRLENGDPFIADLSGAQPAGIHEASFSLAATYNFDIGNNKAFLRGDFYFEDEVQITDNVPAGTVIFPTSGTVAVINGVRETKNLNLSAGLTTQNGYNFSIWARNVTDHETLISTFPGIAQLGTFNGYRNEPRTYGVSLSKEF